MKVNNQSNNIIKWIIIVIDFVVMNSLLLLLCHVHPQMVILNDWMTNSSFLMNNIALIISEYYNPPIIGQRAVFGGRILKQVLKLASSQMILAYVFMKIQTERFPVGMTELALGGLFCLAVIILRFIERRLIQAYRRCGGNVRYITFVGSDKELQNIFYKLNDDVSMGYRILGYYADDEMIVEREDGKNSKTVELKRLGTLQELMNHLNEPETLEIGEELYVCMSRREQDVIRRLSRFCDQNMVRFYYVPVSLETLGINLKRELLDDVEIFTTYENPLENPMNKLFKRIFDIVLSLVFLLLTLPLWPIIWLVIKTQSPGPLFFKQVRTGLDGKDFNMLKFRSMHVNADADKVQATKDDPRKYPFGNFMRMTNIDEFPQFWNVLKGDMSIVGPRPHMLLHTEQYSQLIEKYMVRHFVKPGVTGWAQVTGFRGETKELWQMEERVKRDIWYMENWSIWLDIRIMWMTAKTIFVHDKHAY